MSTRPVLAPLLLGLMATPQLVSPAGLEDWVEVRAADHLARSLSALGIPMLRPLAVPAGAGRPRFIVQVGPHEAQPTDEVALQVRWADRALSRKVVLRRLASGGRALAVDLARALGLDFGEAAPLPGRDLPWPVERRMGQARSRELHEKWTEAGLAYERAANIPGGVWWEALDGVARCRTKLRPELALAAAARARVAARSEAWDEASRAWSSVLKYTPRRGPLWMVPGRFGDWVPAGADAGAVYGATGRQGVSLQLQPARADPKVVSRPFVAAAPGFRVQLDGERRLLRPGRWSRSLDFAPSKVRMAGGHLAVWTPDRLDWVDPSGGRSVTQLSGPILDVGPRGAAIRRGPDLALVRPGQKVPAWKTPVGEARAVAVTGERILALVGPRVLLLRGRDGQIIFDEPLGDGLRLLDAKARHAILAHEDRILVLDILGGRRLFERRGPGRVVAGLVLADGFASAHETGDLILFDGEGTPRRRARWAYPIRGLDRRPEHPRLLMLWTDHALHGLDDPGRDEGAGTALLALAEIRRRAGDGEAALELASAAAALILGPVAEAETMRARLLPEGAARDWAQERARSAARLGEALMPFRALGAPRPVAPQSTSTEAED